MQIPLMLLGYGKYTLEFVQDRINANKDAADYYFGRQIVEVKDILIAKLA